MVAIQQREDLDAPPARSDTAPGSAQSSGGRPSGPQRIAKAVIIASVAVLTLAFVVSATRSGSEIEATGGAADDVDGSQNPPAEIDATTADEERASLVAASAPAPAVATEPDAEPTVEPVELDGDLLGGFARADAEPETAVPAVGMAENMAMIRQASVRNRNHDDSPYASTPQSELVLENHYGPRSDYLDNPHNHPEHAFPVPKGGQFRAACEFSHFAYDDPLVYPGKPGASHLHMFFGNTEANAYTTYESLINSGSSTCNGQELNRTGYWAPAMFDGDGNVRVPERIVVYYKGENLARGRSEVYPPGAAMIANDNLNVLPKEQGGAGGVRLGFLCTDNFSPNTDNGSQTMADCDGSRFGSDPNRPRWTVLEVSIKFPQCWNGEDPSDWTNFSPPVGDWYVSRCEGDYNRTFPNLEYFINYRVEAGERTAGWFLASDVDPVSFALGDDPAGSTVHADWWGGWHPQINRMWIDNCVNYVHPDGVPSGCGRGYLTDGGPDGDNPYDGPALKMRPQYTGPLSVPASTIYEELCPGSMRPYTQSEDAAYCVPGTGHGSHRGHGEMGHGG